MSIQCAIPMKPVIEICVDRLDSVQHCAQAGIDRIELCAALSEGGLSPSLGFLRAARQIFPGKIMMMIRPRAGDFCYAPAEQAMMIDEIAVAREHGADGVVFGCLEPDGRIDQTFTRSLVQAASGLDITFHRAFDVSHDLSSSLESLIELGIPRVLSSGGEAEPKIVTQGPTKCNTRTAFMKSHDTLKSVPRSVNRDRGPARNERSDNSSSKRFCSWIDCSSIPCSGVTLGISGHSGAVIGAHDIRTV